MAHNSFACVYVQYKRSSGSLSSLSPFRHFSEISCECVLCVYLASMLWLSDYRSLGILLPSCRLPCSMFHVVYNNLMSGSFTFISFDDGGDVICNAQSFWWLIATTMKIQLDKQQLKAIFDEIRLKRSINHYHGYYDIFFFSTLAEN